MWPLFLCDRLIQFSALPVDGKRLIPWVLLPNQSERSLYLLFEFLDILKTIRDNCLHLKDHSCIYTLPNFEDLSLSNSIIR